MADSAARPTREQNRSMAICVNLCPSADSLKERSQKRQRRLKPIAPTTQFAIRGNSRSFADNFHIYEVVWAEDYIGWYLDGQIMHYVTPSSYSQQYNWPFNDLERYIMINFAIDSEGPNANTVFPSNIQVDYVRVYQTNDVIGCMDINASNYNPNATTPFILDQTTNLETAIQYTCYVVGCQDENALNYDPDANATGPCEYPIYQLDWRNSSWRR